MTDVADKHTIQRWNQQRLTEDVLVDLGQTEPALGRWINDRIVGVLASPSTETAMKMAVGVSALKPGTSTPVHSHVAEELAIVMSGTGMIHIGETGVKVGAGDVVLTPSTVPHRTESDPDQPLVILWIYAPAGSEQRWLQADPQE